MTSSERLFFYLLLTFVACGTATDDEEAAPSKRSYGRREGPVHFPLTYSHGPRDVQPPFGFQRRQGGGSPPPPRGYNVTRPEGRPLYSDLAEELPYSYEYNVKDDYEGAHFGHKESGEGSNTNGQYFVRLPDGRVQTVTYYTDKEGFHSDVAYAGNVKPGATGEGGYRKAPTPVYGIPVAPPTLPVPPYEGLRIPYLPETPYNKGIPEPVPGKSLVRVPAGVPAYAPSVSGLALYASVRPYGGPPLPPPANYPHGPSAYPLSEGEPFDPDTIYTDSISHTEGSPIGSFYAGSSQRRGPSSGYMSSALGGGIPETPRPAGLTLEITNPLTNETLLVDLDEVDKKFDQPVIKHSKPGAHHEQEEVDIPVPGFAVGTLFRNEVDVESFKGISKSKHG
ncbi:uncharacterized protein LOC135202741 [Macrobrachium nipponense]|uniref:uncharacterized protein LOC135202741 n=1 Tax=Macrobrachium nipponense TaxID=159736 RepID=UPI0030C890DF